MAVALLIAINSKIRPLQAMASRIDALLALQVSPGLAPSQACWSPLLITHRQTIKGSVDLQVDQLGLPYGRSRSIGS